MSPCARTQTFTAGERTCMKGTALFCLGVVLEGVKFSLRTLKMDRKMPLWKNSVMPGVPGIPSKS